MRDGMTNGKQVSVHWNTPKKYVSLIYEFFGEVELDPCSNDYSILDAKTKIKLPQDGLMEEWSQRTIFVNPPYGRDTQRKTSIKNWIQKAYESHRKYGNEILMLLPVSTNTTHWRDFIFGKSSICFLYDSRLKFSLNGNEENKGAPMACCFVYYGERERRFEELFSPYGFVVTKRRDNDSNHESERVRTE